MSDDSKKFVRGILSDCATAAAIKNDKSFMKYAQKLSDKFTENATIIDLKYKDFYAIQQVIDSATGFINNTITNLNNQEIDSDETKIAVEFKLNALNTNLDNATVAADEFKEFGDMFVEDGKKRADVVSAKLLSEE